MSPTKRLTFQTISQDLQGQEPGSQRLSMGACITSPSTNHLHPRHYCSLHSPMDLLLGYASSENENESKESNKRKLSPVGSSKAEAPPQKKRKLPSLSSNFISPTPVSDPSKHQGRVRAHPHVEGQFASYVYIPIPIERGSPLSRLLNKTVKSAKTQFPELHPIIENREGSSQVESEVELHISLTRPVYLRHHQRDDFRNAIRKVALTHPQFPASFATFATFENDERTRAFLAFEVGAGYSELRKLTDALTPTLRSLYQKEYYVEPRFHASIAWALLKVQAHTPSEGPISLSESDVERTENLSPSQPTEFPTITNLPPKILDSLAEHLGDYLRQHGDFYVSHIKVRIGKDTKIYPLLGNT